MPATNTQEDWGAGDKPVPAGEEWGTGDKPVPERDQPMTPGGVVRAMPHALGDVARGAVKGVYQMLGSPGAAHPAAFPGGYEQKEPLPLAKSLSAPSANTAETLGSYAPAALSLVTPGAETAFETFPRTARAGANIEKVIQAVGKHTPVNIDVAAPGALRGEELAQAKFARPAAMRAVRDYLAPGAAQPTFRRTTDLASNLGGMFAAEAERVKGPMKGAVTQTFGALRNANLNEAGKVGMRDVYQQGIDEYRRAKAIQRLGSKVGKYAIPAAIGSAGAGLGYEGYRAAKGMLGE